VEEVLAELLKRLTVVERDHGEVTDTDVRERMDDAVHHGFLIPTPGYRLPDEFAMYTPEGDRAVRDVLAWFLTAATTAAAAEGLDTFHERLAAFQNRGVTVGPQQTCYNDFFGWGDPERYDELGNVIPRSSEPAGPLGGVPGQEEDGPPQTLS
jgi:hypothetical protein